MSFVALTVDWSCRINLELLLSVSGALSAVEDLGKHYTVPEELVALWFSYLRTICSEHLLT